MTFVCLLLVVGASGLAAQIVLLREFLVVASGNELAIGVYLGNWLALEALGCALAGRLWARSERPAAAFALWQAFFAAALPAALYATRGLRALCGAAPGEALSLAAMFGASLAVLACVSVPHGALFALAGRMRQREERGRDPGGMVYGWETFGTLLGGLILTFWLIPRFQSFRIVLAVSALDLLFCLLALASGREERKPRSAALYGLAAAAAAVLALGPAAAALHRASVRGQWPGSRVVFYDNSVYGNITVLENEGQSTFLTDGEVAATSPVPDIESTEELAHFALLAHPKPEDVLVLSGGSGGLLREVLKHPVRRVDYAERDPLLLAALARFAAPLAEGELKDPRVSVHRVDARLFVKDGARRYDAIILGAPRPDSLQANRLLTREFFAMAAARLKPGGLLAFSLPGSTAFLEPNLASLNSCVLQAAAEVFAAVRPIPGDTNIVLASVEPGLSRLDAGLLAGRLRQRRIHTGFVGPQQLALRLEPQWTDMFQGFLAPVAARAGVNRDFNPRAVRHELGNWNAMFSPLGTRLFVWAESLTVARLAGVLALLALAAWAWQRRSRGLGPIAAPLAIAATGWAGMVYNMTLTFAFQALYGYVYLWIGILVSVFMAGAAAASLLLSRGARPSRRAFLISELALVLFSAALPLAFQALAGTSVPDGLMKAAFLLLCLASGALTGAQFPLACRLGGAGMSALYSWDLLGGWLGAVAGGAVLLPVLGLRSVCLGTALLKLATFALCAAALEEKP
ncbi:MAG: fused MFS/spermidine synthase [Elusimicrobia bacterium]|nr:fused MFS/spermidine synthase [Elusimicrobiota bacterium]